MELQSCPGFFITEDGIVYFGLTGRHLAVHIDKKGYSRVNLPKVGVKRIHRLVAETYIPNPNNLPIVDHIDRNKQNNTIENLRWVDDFGSSQNRGVSYKSSTGEKNIYLMKNRHGNHKYVYMKQGKVDGKKKKLCEKWFDTLDDAISFRNSL